MALQFYAYGYALAPDAAAYESYWSKDHGYHQSPTGSNTVLPGYTEGDITIHAMEPMVKEGEFVNDRELTPYLNFADVSAGEKEEWSLWSVLRGIVVIMWIFSGRTGRIMIIVPSCRYFDGNH